MKFSFVATAVAALFVSGGEAQGGCYGSGLGFPNKDTAYWHANRACYGYEGNRGAFQDVYFKPYNESPYPATACVNSGDNWHIVMQWTNQRNYGQTLSPQYCWDQLRFVIDKCWAGGDFTAGYDWKFRLDPNSGYC